MKETRRNFIETLLALPALTLAAQAQEPVEQIKPVVLRGRVVNLAEVMQQEYKIEMDAQRGAIYCLKTADGKFYPILPTDLSAAIYEDIRFRQRELQITARAFKEFSFIEVIKLQSVKWGRVYDLYFYCIVCNIKSHKGGPCECCQAPFDFVEEPVKDNNPN